MQNYLKKEIYEFLRKEEGVNEFLKDSPLEGFWFWDVEKPELDVSDGDLWSILGFKPNMSPKLLSPWHQINSQEDFKAALNKFLAHIRYLSTCDDSLCRYTHKNGSTIIIRSTSLTTTPEEGKSPSNIGLHYDFTIFNNKEKGFVNAIEKADFNAEQPKIDDKRYLSIFENMNFGIIVFLPIKKGTDYIIHDINKKALEIIKQPYEELVGKSFLQRFPNFETSPLFEALQNVNLTNESLHLKPFYYKGKFSDGWREHYIFALPTGELVTMFDDVTERKNAEIKFQNHFNELSQAKEKAEAELKVNADVYDNFATGVIIYDTNAKIIYSNAKASKVLSVKSKDMKGKAIYDLGWLIFSENNTPLPVEKCPFRRVISTGEDVNNCIIGFSNPNDEEKKWIMANAAPIRNDKGEVESVTLCITDYTANKNEELAITKLKEKAEERDLQKSAFLANMSHEIRTPMNGILGFTELLKEPNLTEEDQGEYINIIEKSGARLLSIINNLIDISKVESGLMHISLSETNVNEQLEYIFNFFKPEVEAKGMEIAFHNALPHKDAFINTDSEKMYAILINLVKNAIKYSKNGRIDIGYLHKDNQLEFYVKDTGMGIPEDTKKNIFDRFVRVNSKDNQSIQGAGLGLSITKAYVEMLGGSVWVESTLGKGSVFYFSLPYNADKQVSKIKKPEKTQKENESLKILIAEEDDSAFLLITIALKKIQHTLLHATNGKEAIKLCKENPDLDLILMDIKMPVMDGHQATREIRKFNKDIIIIAQTAYSLAGDREKALDSGCNDYISKPINQASLLMLIKKYFKILKPEYINK